MKPSSSSVLEATIAGVVRLAAVWSALVVGAFGRSAARAGTIWDGGGGDTNLTTAANWDDDSAPTFTGGTSTLTFGTGGSTATVDTAADLARIILDRDSAFAIANGSGSLTLQGEDVGGVLTGITASPATSGTTVAYTISESVALGATQSWNVANNGAGTTSLSVSGVISGAAPNLTKLGSGTLTLSGANTFTGSLTVAEGVLSINSWNNVSTNGPLGNSAANVVLGSATTAGTLRYTGAAVDPPATPRGIELAAGGGVIQLTGVGRNSGRVHISGSSISGSGPLTIDNPNGARFLIVGSSTFSGPVTVQAGELQLNLDPTTTLGGGSNGLGSAVTLNSGAVLTLWRNGGSSTVRLGSLAGGGTVRSESGGTQTLSVGGDDTSTTFSGVIQDSYSSLNGSIALTKVGSGTLTLSGSNTYSGDTTISAGRLELTGNGVLGSGSYAGTIANAGELVVGTDAAQILAGVISGTGSVTKSGAGTLTLSAANSFTGVVAINEGTVEVGSWNLSATNGVWGNQTNNPASPATTFIQMNGGRINYTGASASGNLRGVNLASGTNTIDVIGGATLSFGFSGGSSGWNRFQSNGGDLVKEGAGTLALGSDGVANNIFTGKASINSGTLEWWGGGSMPTPPTLVSDFLTINDGATFAMSYNGGSTVNANIGFRLAGNTTIVSGTGGSHTIAGPIADGASAGSLIKTGAGMLTLTGANDYSGGTTISAGTLTLGNDAALGSGSVSVAGGSLNLGGRTIANAVSISAGVLSGGTIAAAQVAATAGTIDAVLSGDGGIAKGGPGTLTLSGANSFTGVVAINEGTVEVGSWNLSATNGVWGNQTNNPASPATTFIQMNGGRINYTGASASGDLRGVNLASGTNTIDVIGGATLSFGISGGSPGWNRFQSNGGDLVKEGAGTLALGSTGVANNIFTGKSTINSGTLDWFGGGSMPEPPTLVSDFLTINDGATFAMSFGTGSTVDANIGFNLVGNATVLSAGTSGTGHTIAGPIADGASAGSLIKTGAGVLTLSGSNSYTGSTTVSTGTLKLGSTGSLASSNAISVASGATFDVSSLAGGLTIAASQSLGGAGSIIGSLVFSGDSKLDFTSSLTVNSGTVTFNGFGIDDILGLDGTVVSAGTYTLLGGSATFDLTNAFNVGAGNAADIGGGKSAYLQAGSLQVVVVPEPGAFALAALGMAAVAYGCRRRRS